MARGIARRKGEIVRQGGGGHAVLQAKNSEQLAS